MQLNRPMTKGRNFLFSHSALDPRLPGPHEQCTEMVEAAMECDADHNGKLEACEAYSCELYLEADHRENTCPSWYDPRPMMVDSCRPCLKDASSSFDLDYYGLPSCSSKGTDTASKQIQLKKAKKGSIKLVRELFRAAHKKGRQHLPSAQALS